MSSISFYKPSNYKGFVKFFKKHNFRVRQDGGHMVGIHPANEEIAISVPRHTCISNGVTMQLCKKLMELGYTAEEVKKYIIK